MASEMQGEIDDFLVACQTLIDAVPKAEGRLCAFCDHRENQTHGEGCPVGIIGRVAFGIRESRVLKPLMETGRYKVVEIDFARLVMVLNGTMTLTTLDIPSDAHIAGIDPIAEWDDFPRNGVLRIVLESPEWEVVEWRGREHLSTPMVIPAPDHEAISRGMERLQLESEQLGLERFPDSTLETTWKHLAEEWTEELVPAMVKLRRLFAGYAAGRYVHPQLEAQVMEAVVDECADIVILLAQLANKVGFDLGRALDEKWTRVKERPYAKGDDGVYRHTKGV